MEPTSDAGRPQPHSIKLRLVWHDSGSQSGRPKQCFNETLRDRDSFDNWRQRVATKFNAGEVLLSYSVANSSCEPVARQLLCSDDFDGLREAYRAALARHSKASTCRATVFVSPPGSTASAAPVAGVQTRSQHKISLQSSTSSEVAVAAGPRPSAGAVGETGSKPALGKSNRASGNTPVPVLKKKRVQAADERTPEQEPGEQQSLAVSDVCWDTVLRSIVKTVDRNHWSSKLQAITAADASAAS